jgi:hypothetical protein
LFLKKEGEFESDEDSFDPTCRTYDNFVFERGEELELRGEFFFTKSSERHSSNTRYNLRDGKGKPSEKDTAAEESNKKKK